MYLNLMVKLGASSEPNYLVVHFYSNILSKNNIIFFSLSVGFELDSFKLK